MLLHRVLLVSLFFATSNAQACYWPDGSKDNKLPQPDYVPCNGASSDGFSSCCNVNDTCTTNGFCKYNGLANTNFLWRNTCSDPSGRSPNCAQHCTVNPKTNNDIAIAAGKPYNNSRLVQACSQTTYCCFPDVNFGSGFIYRDNFAGITCCNDSSQIFDAGPADFLSGLRYFTTSLFPVTMTSTRAVSSSPSIMTTMATTSPTSGGSNTTSATTTTGGSNVVSATLSPSVASNATSASISPENQASSNKLSVGAKAGLGIGAAFVAVLAIALAAWLVMRYRRGHSGTLRSSVEEKGSAYDFYSETEGAGKRNAAELPGEARTELPPASPSELPAKNHAAWSELPIASPRELPSKHCQSPRELP